MNTVVHECPECCRLRSQYEAATFAQAKIHHEMDEADYLHDRAYSRLLTLEAYEVTARRRGARAALAQHHEMVHGLTEGRAA